MEASDHLTAFGLALRLDEWETTRNANHRTDDGNHCSWVHLLAEEHPIAEDTLKNMLNRIEQIGMDHAIRRKLHWDVEPGTLAELVRSGPQWVISAEPKVISRFVPVAQPWATHVPALADVTDPAEALKAIYRAIVFYDLDRTGEQS